MLPAMGNPDLVNQLTAGGQYPHEDCGEACVLSVLVDAGKVSSVRDIEQFDLAHGDNPADGTGGDVHVERLQAAGLGAHVMTGDTRANVVDGISKGHDRWMVAIWSDHYGDPSPGSGIGHWLLVYAYDQGSDTFHVMNPVGGRLVAYSGASIEAAQQSYGVAVETPIGVAQAQPVNNGAVVGVTVVTYPEDAMQSFVGQVTMGGGRGWVPLPSTVPAAKVVNVIVQDQAPDRVGAYVPVPAFVGVASDRNELVFGNGPDGATPDGTYGFVCWSVD